MCKGRNNGFYPTKKDEPVKNCRQVNTNKSERRNKTGGPEEASQLNGAFVGQTAGQRWPGRMGKKNTLKKGGSWKTKHETPNLADVGDHKKRP